MGAKTQPEATLKAVEPDEGRPVTSYDVARLAGVSQSAVSRCFKPGASVSARMREKVMKAAQQLGYEPNAIARSLITRRSNLVAVLISNLTNLYYPEVLAELTGRFSDRGYRVLLFSLQNDADVDEVLAQIWPYRVDGVVAAAELSPDHVEEFAKRRIPLILYNRHLAGLAVNSVCCDQEDAAAQLVDSLVDAGHRALAFISGPPGSQVGVERMSGVIDRADHRGLGEVTVAPGAYSYESGYNAAYELWQNQECRPDAIICANDMMALGAIDALRMEMDVVIPDEVSVVGFDGVGPSYWKAYQLTTVRQPVRRMTEAAVSMLLALIEEPNSVTEKRVFSGTLKVGSSARFQGAG